MTQNEIDVFFFKASKFHEFENACKQIVTDNSKPPKTPKSPHERL